MISRDLKKKMMMRGKKNLKSLNHHLHWDLLLLLLLVLGGPTVNMLLLHSSPDYERILEVPMKKGKRKERKDEEVASSSIPLPPWLNSMEFAACSQFHRQYPHWLSMGHSMDYLQCQSDPHPFFFFLSLDPDQQQSRCRRRFLGFCLALMLSSV